MHFSMYLHFPCFFIFVFFYIFTVKYKHKHNQCSSIHYYKFSDEDCYVSGKVVRLLFKLCDQNTSGTGEFPSKGINS